MSSVGVMICLIAANPVHSVDEAKIAEILAGALNSVTSVEAKVTWSITRDGRRFTTRVAEWGYEDGKEYLSGTAYRWKSKPKAASPQPMSYRFKSAYDGVALRAFRDDSRKGSIRPAGTYFRTYRTPLTFLGREMIDGRSEEDPTDDLAPFFQSATIVKETQSDLVVQSDWFTRAYVKQRAVVTLAKDFSLAPRQVELIGARGELWSRFVVDEFHLTNQGVAIPVVMKEFTGRFEYRFPKEMDDPRITQARRKELWELRELTRQWIDEFSPLILRVERKSLKVNHDVDDDKFSFEFPAEIRYWNRFDGTVHPPLPPPQRHK